MKKKEITKKKPSFTNEDFKELIDSAFNALHGLPGSGDKTHDRLADALKPFAKMKTQDDAKKI